MIPIPKKYRQIIDEDPFFRRCCHRHECEGRIEMEHAYQRQNGMAPFVVPVCYKANHSPDKETKLYSQYCCIKYWGIDTLKNANPKKDWDKEWRLLSNRFDAGKSNGCSLDS